MPDALNVVGAGEIEPRRVVRERLAQRPSTCCRRDYISLVEPPDRPTAQQAEARQRPDVWLWPQKPQSPSRVLLTPHEPIPVGHASEPRSQASHGSRFKADRHNVFDSAKGCLPLQDDLGGEAAAGPV